MTLLYDADCGFCTRAAAVADRVLKRVEVGPMQSVDLAGRGVDVTRAQAEIPFVDAAGSVHYGSDAIASAFVANGGWTVWIGRFLLIWPVRVLAHIVYGLVARNRYRLPGGTAACALPTSSD